MKPIDQTEHLRHIVGGARLVIGAFDTQRVGTTPLTLATVPTGTHAVRLELEGYRRWSSTVRVTAGERNRVTASLDQ